MITFTCIYREEDEHYLNGMLSSLPKNFDVVLMKCIQTDKLSLADTTDRIKEFRLEDINIKQCEYYYSNWSFAKARNACHIWVETEWVFVVDADERVVFEERDYDLIKNLDKKIGGCLINVVSTEQAGNLYQSKGVPTIRLYRRLNGFEWRNRCHEQIGFSIQERGYIIASTPMIMRHLGYQGEIPELYAKAIRNKDLMYKDLAELKVDDDNKLYLEAKLLRTLNHINEFRKKVKDVNEQR